MYVVFGATGGIGSALCKRLVAQPGASVVLAGRDAGRLEQLQQSLGGGIPMVADPLDPKQVSTWCVSFLTLPLCRHVLLGSTSRSTTSP